MIQSQEGIHDKMRIAFLAAIGTCGIVGHIIVHLMDRNESDVILEFGADNGNDFL